jgi:glycosyltransferase involved in cell wall biosynthesis
VPIIKSLQSQYPKISLLHETKQGAAAARNTGLRNCKGEWIQLLDADDLILKNKIEHQISLAKDNIAFVAGASTYLKTNGQKINHQVNDKNLVFNLFFQLLGNTCSNLYNAQIVKQTNLQDESLSFSEETDFMFSLLKCCPKIVADEQALTIIRERHYGSINKGDKTKKHIGFIEVRYRLIKFLQQIKPEYYQANREQFNNYIFEHIRALARNDFELADIYRKKFEILSLNSSMVSGKKKLYALLFNSLGFYTTEKIINFLSILKAFRTK